MDTHIDNENKLVDAQRVNRSKYHLEITQGLQLLSSRQHHEPAECQLIPSLPAATALAPPISHYINAKAIKTHMFHLIADQIREKQQNLSNYLSTN